ncbi:MAG: class I SAM-dependent methyltransferase [Candidatus Woykebacteria bacterium]
MDLQEQKEVSAHFERMFTKNIKPWREHGPEPLLLSFLKLLKEKSTDDKGLNVLDIGCGDGWVSLLAAREGNMAWGIDSSETAIAQAKETAKNSSFADRVHFQVGDALYLPFEKAQFYALIDRGLFHHILPENRSLYLKNIRRVLKPKSYFYLSVFSDKNSPGFGQLFNQLLIEKIFGKDFTVLKCYEDPFPPYVPAHLLHFIFERK